MVAGAGEFGEFLQARRALLTPRDVGLACAVSAASTASMARRRVRGLRREEVAALAGLSAAYLARLEQGRDRHPSTAVVEQLGRVLQLDPAGRAHLHRLAFVQPPRADDPSGSVRPGVRQLVRSWTEQAAFVLDRFGWVRVANELARALYPGFEPGTNILRSVFLDDHARSYDPDHELVAPRIVADIRATSVGATDHPPFAALLDELRANSAEFARLWARHDAREKTLGVKRFRHPDVGPLALSFECLTLNGAPDHTVFVLFPEPGSVDERKLRRLAAIVDRSGVEQLRDE